MLINKHSKVFLLLLFLFASILLSIRAYVIRNFNPNWSELSFDKKIWDSSANLSLNNPRALMASDIKSILIGKKLTKQEVLELLGQPFQSYTEQRTEPNVMRYYLGEPCYGTSVCSLKIKFNSHGQIASVSFN